MNVLVLNSGSSSQKSCLYSIAATPSTDPLPCVWEGKIEWNGSSAHSSIKSGGTSRHGEIQAGSRAEYIERLLTSIWTGEASAISSPKDIDVVGHRVVHGGPRYLEPTIVDSEVTKAIAAVSAFAPLHNRAELEGMEIAAKLLGKLPQVAVFDTGFHRTMPPSASTYAGPYEWLEQGIHRYGFHGINHQYCSERAPQLLGRSSSGLKIVSCHLGNGCSLAAIRDGRSVDTTMGFTPLDGVMMGTRSGSVDPGILTYLMRQHKLSGEQLDNLLNKKSGLLGLSGISGDMREILSAIKADHDRAKLAFAVYVHRLQSAIGSMVGVLGGVDVLIFTAGVGENAPEVRAAVCDNLAFLGLRIDPQKNEVASSKRGDSDISADKSRVRTLVICAQEDWMIARACWTALNSSTPGKR